MATGECGFLVINRDQRRQAEDEKRRVGAKTADRPLWEGAFVQPRNTTRRSSRNGRGRVRGTAHDLWQHRILDHGLGLQTLYAHLSSIDVKVGDQIAKGQQPGRSGTTGLAISDHVHYEMHVHR